jgi:hypothetical protein
MFAARITLPHLSISAATEAPSSSGVSRSGVVGHLGEAGVYLAVEAGDDRGRRAARHADAAPRAGDMERHRLAGRRNVRSSGAARALPLSSLR